MLWSSQRLDFMPLACCFWLFQVGFWSQGRRSGALAAGLYPLLRIVPVPYYAAWDCRLKDDLLARERPITVAFAGSIKEHSARITTVLHV